MHTGPQRRFATALALLLVFAQSFGFMHRAAHGSGLIDHERTQSASWKAESTGHWVQALFAGHDDGADCPLFDSLMQAAGPSAAVSLSLSLPAPCRPLALARGDYVSRWAALFDARGPPLFR